MRFTYDAYAELLESIVAKYQIVDYHSYCGISNPCILRHDIDTSPALGVRLAEIEAAHHAKATYFVLLKTGFYNCAFSDTVKSLNKIQNLGHEIGLHFDEMQYDDCDTDEALKEHIYCEAEILGRLLGVPIKAVSMHRPSKRTLESNYELDGLVNSYGKTFLNDFKYLSDSRMHWREDVERIVVTGQYKALHISTHPIWYDDVARTTHDVLYQFVWNAKEERYSLLADNFRDLDEILGKYEIQ